MYGLLLQILGQYQGLLRNFCDRSQRVSPLWMTYSSGVPGTGWMLASGGGRGLCSVTTGAVSVRCGGGCCCGCCSGWGCAAGSCCAPAPIDTTSAPARAALRHRAIVFVRMYRLRSEILQELLSRHRLGRVGVLLVELEKDPLRLVLAAQHAQAA